MQVPGAEAWSRGHLQVSHLDEVERCEAENKEPVDCSLASQLHLAQASDVLEPGWHTFDLVTACQAHRVALVARSSSVDRTAPIRHVLNHVRCHALPAQILDECLHVV